MRLLLDTHFVLWIVLRSRRLDQHPWIDRYRPWGVSPISLLEIQFLAEVGRIEVRNPVFTEALLDDARFVVDEVPLLSLMRQAIGTTWTRDPFDRLLAAHSQARRVPLATLDEDLRRHHPLIAAELRASNDDAAGGAGVSRPEQPEAARSSQAVSSRRR